MKMKDLLRILIVEDSEDDALLVLHQIKKGGYRTFHERVERAEEMKAALKEKDWDLIIADYRLPHFNGLEALALFKESGIDIPFIIISGAIGEDLAVETIRRGASDYLMKENLKRLVPVIERELRETSARAKRRQDEETLALMSFALNNVSDAVFLVDESASIHYVNEEACRVLGYTHTELLGMTVSDINPDLIPERWPDHWNQVKALGALLFEGRHQTKDGRIFPVEINASYFEYGNRPYRLTFVRDITERQRVERQLQQAQKMEAIGTLAGGIAHDFNNILSSIFGFTEIAKARLGMGEDVRKDLDEVLKAGLRARDLVKHILLFSRQVDVQRTPVALSPLIKECLKFIRASVPSTIEIRQDMAVSAGAVVADPTEIHQIVMNLCTNAAHAMAKKGGVLDVRLAEVNIENESAPPYRQLKTGRYFKLSIVDTGHGIPPELMDRIFEPFFSTKNRVEGTGLGLSIVHGIVTKLGGAISAESEPGKGAAFHVWLPAHEEAAASVHLPDMPGKGRRGKILFVDDEDNIVMVSKKLLENLGYTVIATTSSLHALELAKSGEHRFDLVITDLTMPKMSGIELSKQLLAVKPGIPIILCTGFSAGVSREMLEQVGIREIIMKPVIAAELAETIDRVLNG